MASRAQRDATPLRLMESLRWASRYHAATIRCAVVMNARMYALGWICSAVTFTLPDLAEVFRGAHR